MKERGNPLLKKADRYLGIPLVWTLGLIKSKRKLPKFKPEDKVRFMLLKTAGIGDTILTQGILQEIKKNYPNSTIDYVCTSTNYAMAKLLPEVDTVYKFEIRKPLMSLMKLKNLSQYDFLIDFAPWTKINAVIAATVTARFKVGFKRQHMYRHYVYDAYVEHLDTVHEIDNYRNLLVECGFRIYGFNPAFSFSSVSLTNIFPLTSNQYITFHICAGGSKSFLKSWNIKNWQELSHELYTRYKLPIVLTGVENDIPIIQPVIDFGKQQDIPIYSYAGKLNLKQTGAVLERTRLLITVDTGIMHLGAALNIPEIALQGPTSSLRWGPLGSKCLALRSSVTCRPCISLGFDTDCVDPQCMKQLTVDKVMQAVIKLIE